LDLDEDNDGTPDIDEVTEPGSNNSSSPYFSTDHSLITSIEDTINTEPATTEYLAQSAQPQTVIKTESSSAVPKTAILSGTGNVAYRALQANIVAAETTTNNGTIVAFAAAAATATTSNSTKRTTVTISPIARLKFKCDTFNFKPVLRRCCKGEKKDGPQFFTKQDLTVCNNKKTNNKLFSSTSEYFLNKLQNIRGQSNVDYISNRASKTRKIVLFFKITNINLFYRQYHWTRSCKSKSHFK